MRLLRLSKVENQLLTVSGVHISFVFYCTFKLRVGCLFLLFASVFKRVAISSRDRLKEEKNLRRRGKRQKLSRTVMGIERLKSKARPMVRDLDAFAICRVRYSSVKSLT